MRHDLIILKQWIQPQARVLDLGCGDGALLDDLVNEKNISGLGIEIDADNITGCIGKGLSVIEQDIDNGLSNFSDNSFDTVIMSQTIQVLKEPKKALLEVTRIGTESIVTIPNFGFWTTRFKLLFLGKMPVTNDLPSSWFETENIHLCTIKDFESLCNELSINIEEKRFFNPSGKENFLINFLPNLFASSAIYKISK